MRSELRSLVERLGDELVDRPELGRRRCRVRLQARELEQVRHEPFEPPGLDVDRLDELGAVELVELELFGAKPVRRCPDRRERRAKVVRDRLQDGRLDGVAPPKRIGVDSLLLQSLAVDGNTDERGQSGQEAAALRDARRFALGQVQRADQALVDLQRVRGLARGRRMPAELDSCPADPEYLRGPLGDRFELLAQLPTAEQVAGDLGEQCGFTLALLRLGGSPAHAVGEQAHGDSDDDIGRERKPVRPVGERERVNRRQVEPVEREDARDRHRQRISHSPERRDDEHGDDVEHAEAEHRDEGLEQLDRQGDHARPRRRCPRWQGDSACVSSRGG